MQTGTVLPEGETNAREEKESKEDTEINHGDKIMAAKKGMDLRATEQYRNRMKNRMNELLGDEGISSGK